MGWLLSNPSTRITHPMVFFSPFLFLIKCITACYYSWGYSSPDGFPAPLWTPFRRKWNSISQFSTLNQFVFPRSLCMLTSLFTELQEDWVCITADRIVCVWDSLTFLQWEFKRHAEVICCMQGKLLQQSRMPLRNFSCHFPSCSVKCCQLSANGLTMTSQHMWNKTNSLFGDCRRL